MTSYSSFSITALLAYLATYDFPVLGGCEDQTRIFYTIYVNFICTYIVYTYICIVDPLAVGYLRWILVNHFN